MVYKGIRTSIAKKPYSSVLFRGGGGTDSCPPSGSAHVRNIVGSDDASVLTELSS